MKSITEKLLKWFLLCLKVLFWLYVIIVTLFGIYIGITLFYNAVRPADMPVHLSSGFMYDEDPFGAVAGVITDNQHPNHNQIIVAGDVLAIMWQDSFVYGMRRINGNDIYYFICSHGEDCSKTQELSEEELAGILENKNLPAFSPLHAKSRDRLRMNDWWINGKRHGPTPEMRRCPDHELQEQGYQICWFGTEPQKY